MYTYNVYYTLKHREFVQTVCADSEDEARRQVPKGASVYDIELVGVASWAE